MNDQNNISKKLRIVEGQQARVEPDIGKFPLEFFCQEFSPDTYQFIDWHWHTGVQFCYITKGRFHFQIVGDVVHLDEKDGIFINAQQVHTAAPEGSFGLELLAHLILLWNQLLNILPEFGYMENISKNNRRMQEILSYLQDNFTRKISLQEIADHVHLSRSECSRFFHFVSGRSLFQYLTEFRVNRSIELLLHTDKSVTEIAYETGFGSQSYFNQRFRMVKGMAPEQFRKTMIRK